MADKYTSSETSTDRRTGSFRKTGYFTHLVLKALSNLEHGRLSLSLPDGKTHVFGSSDANGIHAAVSIKRWRALRLFATGGDQGLARAYIDGDWTSPDLTALFDLALANENNTMVWYNGNVVARVISRIRHLMRGNSRRGSRRNIAYHYDLGNAFYETWLDPSMTYSSAYYTDASMTLEQAQHAKYDRIMEMGEIGEGHKVLEIGCGWAGFACHAAERGAHVHGITVSNEQLKYGQERADRLECETRPDLTFTDYRDVRGSYDRIVSIEMLEAVGEKYWPVYFSVLRDRLKAGGIAMIQVITIEDHRFDAYRRGTDFIQRYIFPGGMLLSPGAMQRLSEQAGLVVDEVDYFRLSYARTLGLWNTRFQKAWPELSTMGFDLPFKRMWEYYLGYCEAGFKAGNIDVGLFRIRKPA